MLLLFLLLQLPPQGPAPARDTVFAVRKLFRQKRGGAEGMAATGLAATSGAALGHPLYQTPQPGGSDLAAALITGGVPTALGLAGMARYSAARENEVLRLYAQGWGLPPDIRRKLRRRHFRVEPEDVQGGRSR